MQAIINSKISYFIYPNNLIENPESLRIFFPVQELSRQGLQFFWKNKIVTVTSVIGLTLCYLAYKTTQKTPLKNPHLMSPDGCLICLDNRSEISLWEGHVTANNVAHMLCEPCMRTYKKKTNIQCPCCRDSLSEKNLCYGIALDDLTLETGKSSKALLYKYLIQKKNYTKLLLQLKDPSFMQFLREQKLSEIQKFVEDVQEGPPALQRISVLLLIQKAKEENPSSLAQIMPVLQKMPENLQHALSAYIEDIKIEVMSPEVLEEFFSLMEDDMSVTNKGNRINTQQIIEKLNNYIKIIKSSSTKITPKHFEFPLIEKIKTSKNKEFQSILLDLLMNYLQELKDQNPKLCIEVLSQLHSLIDQELNNQIQQKIVQKAAVILYQLLLEEDKIEPLDIPFTSLIRFMSQESYYLACVRILEKMIVSSSISKQDEIELRKLTVTQTALNPALKAKLLYNLMGFLLLKPEPHTSGVEKSILLVQDLIFEKDYFINYEVYLNYKNSSIPPKYMESFIQKLLLNIVEKVLYKYKKDGLKCILNEEENIAIRCINASKDTSMEEIYDTLVGVANFEEALSAIKFCIALVHNTNMTKQKKFLILIAFLEVISLIKALYDDPKQIQTLNLEPYFNSWENLDRHCTELSGKFMIEFDKLSNKEKQELLTLAKKRSAKINFKGMKATIRILYTKINCTTVSEIASKFWNTIF